MENMNPGMEIDVMRATATIEEQPLKVSDEATMSHEALEDQAKALREALRMVGVDTPGTCIDERPRVGLLSGEAKIEPRQSAPGGPNIYSLYMAELIGYFKDSDQPAKERLIAVTRAINDSGVPSGGHKSCAANAKFEAVLGLMGGANAEQGRLYAQEQLGNEFDNDAYSEVVRNATAVFESGLYADWNEDILIEVLGNEAGEAIEILQGEHEGRTFARVDVENGTVDQTELHNAVGEDSFVNDEPYNKKIERVIADGPDAAWKLKVARHGREALLSALYFALPNRELHQINISV